MAIAPSGILRGGHDQRATCTRCDELKMTKKYEGHEEDFPLRRRAGRGHRRGDARTPVSRSETRVGSLKCKELNPERCTRRESRVRPRRNWRAHRPIMVEEVPAASKTAISPWITLGDGGRPRNSGTRPGGRVIGLDIDPVNCRAPRPLHARPDSSQDDAAPREFRGCSRRSPPRRRTSGESDSPRRPQACPRCSSR